jgi:GNAT superfamily N-acetyltransferase
MVPERSTPATLPVGLVMLADDVPPDDPTIRWRYHLWRMLIDEWYQGRGYGRAALDGSTTSSCFACRWCRRERLTRAAAALLDQGAGWHSRRGAPSLADGTSRRREEHGRHGRA